ncbi:CHAT domain-containing tetratricopeptide repeat protein [Lentzea sp. NPDC004782]|uniref:CHAT domain-containing protein n=1 Tax=Lentzea sp. NPDC004782 TaxID=3154458 RepID=UPI0033B5A4E1
MEPLLRLLDRLLRARSIDELIMLVDTTPEALSSEFFDVMGRVMSEATVRGDVNLAAGIERLAHVLNAMRGEVPAGDARVFAVLSEVGPVFVDLVEDANWPGWARILAANPFLFSAEFIDHLFGLRDLVRADDLWLFDAFAQLLVECHDEGPQAALPRWASTATAGEAAFLPSELQLAGLEYVAEALAPRRDLATAEAFGNLGKMLYARQLGDRVENLARADQALRAAIALAEAGGAVLLRAGCQQALVNVVLATNETDQDTVRAAFDIATEATQGWDHESDPELWGLLMTSRANCLRQMHRTDEAIESYHQALSVFTRESDPKRWGIAVFGLGSAYLTRAKKPSDLEDLDQAIVFLEQAAEVRTRDVHEGRWAMTQDALAWAYYTRRGEESDDLERAAGHFRNALDFHRPGSPHRAQSLSGLGQVLHRLGRGRADLINAKQILEEALEDPGPPFPADAHRVLARIYHDLDGSDPAAVEHQQLVLDLTRADTNTSQHVIDVIQLCDYLTDVHQVDGDVRAITLLNELLPTLSGVDRAFTLHSLGTMHTNNRVGDRAESARLAMASYREALTEITEETAPQLWAQLHCRIAGLLIPGVRRRDQDDEAERQRRAEVFRLLDIALDSATRHRNDSLVNTIRLTLVEARSTIDREPGIEDLEAIREHYRREGDVLEFARTQSRLAKAYGSDDRRTIWAADTARRLLPIASDPGEFGLASERLGAAYVRQGEQERAGHAYRDAVRARGLALRLARLPSDEQQVRASFRGNMAEQACLAFARAAEQNTDPAKRRTLAVLAVESLDEGRMRGFPEFATTHLDEVTRVDPELARAYREALARLRACTRADRAVMTGSLTGPKLLVNDSGDWLATRDEARVAAAELDRVLLAIRERTGLDLAMPPLSVPEIAALLAPDEAFAYLLSDDAGDGTQGHLLLLVRADGEVVFRWATPKVNEFYEVATWLPNQSAFSSGSATKLLSDALGAAFPVAAELLTGPLAEELRRAGATRVHLVPCGILGNFPFHAAPAPDRPLGEEFAVSYLPSAAVLKSLRQRASTTGPSRLVTVANPLPNPKPLPYALLQQEVVTAAARTCGIPSVELAEHAATLQAVRDAMPAATHLDFACHGRLDQGWMLDSGLTLADGQLVLRDVLDSDLLAGVRLVTLTSCQSGAAPGNPFQDEPMSFATGFLVAGAGAVLGTLWLVDDLATALLSGRFYHHHLVDDLPLPVALGRAQRWLRELTAADLAAELGEPSSDPVHALIRPFEHPLYWASFVLSCE